jgi:hypothetical protein
MINNIDYNESHNFEANAIVAHISDTLFPQLPVYRMPIYTSSRKRYALL